MNSGRIEQDGTPEELYFHPANRFVAEFIGETNLITGEVKGNEGDDVVIDWFGETLRGHTRLGAPNPNGRVTASIRLEGLELYADKPDAANAIKGKIAGTAFLGSRTVVDVLIEIADGLTLKTYADAAAGFAANGETVWLGWSADRMAILSD